MSIIRAKYKHRCPKLTLRLVWNVNRESESRYRRPLRRCMRNIILRSANAKFHYILPFFYKMNEGDLPLLYSCVFWRELGEFIDLVVFFFCCYCVTPVTPFVKTIVLSLSRFICMVKTMACSMNGLTAVTQ